VGHPSVTNGEFAACVKVREPSELRYGWCVRSAATCTGVLDGGSRRASGTGGFTCGDAACSEITLGNLVSIIGNSPFSIGYI